MKSKAVLQSAVGSYTPEEFDAVKSRHEVEGEHGSTYSLHLAANRRLSSRLRESSRWRSAR